MIEIFNNTTQQNTTKHKKTKEVKTMEKTEFINIIFDGLGLIVLIGLLLLSPILLENLLK